MQFSNNGQLLVSASWEHTIKLWDTATGILRTTLEGHTNAVAAVVFSGNDQYLAPVSRDQTLRLWNPEAENYRVRLKVTDFSTAMAFSGNSQLLASGSDDRTVRLWDSPIGMVRTTYEGYMDWVHAVAFSGAGLLLASAS